MSDHSKNYLLPLPSPTDYYDVNIVNGITVFLDDKLGGVDAVHPLVTIHHGLGAYPMVLMGRVQYALGVGGLGEKGVGGTDADQCMVRARYLNSGALAVLVTKEISQLGGEAALHQINNREYTITWPGNHEDSLYIRLI